jgi:hypothetical protein
MLSIVVSRMFKPGTDFIVTSPLPLQKKTPKCGVLNEDTLDETGATLEHSSQKSIRYITRKTRASSCELQVYPVLSVHECKLFTEGPGMHAKQQRTSTAIGISFICNSSCHKLVDSAGNPFLCSMTRQKNLILQPKQLNDSWEALRLITLYDDKMGARVSWTELYVVSMAVTRLGQALGRMGDYYMKLNCTA